MPSRLEKTALCVNAGQQCATAGFAEESSQRFSIGVTMSVRITIAKCVNPTLQQEKIAANLSRICFSYGYHKR